MSIFVKTKEINIEFQNIQLLFSKFEKQFLNLQLQSVQYSDTLLRKQFCRINKNILLLNSEIFFWKLPIKYWK